MEYKTNKAGSLSALTNPSIRRPLFPRSLAAVAVACLALSGSLKANDDNKQALLVPDLPSPVCDSVMVAEGNRVSAHVYAMGVQIYRWNGDRWVFIAPDATLYADPCYQGEVGTHYAGPTWESKDGSQARAISLASCKPYLGAIPWLRLGVVSTSDHGRFAGVTFIQRINTIGGTAPAEPGAFIGDEARVPYTAEYIFYR